MLLLACRASSSSPSPGETDASATTEPCLEEPVEVTAAAHRPTLPLTQLVNPFIGTGGVGYGVGSAHPGPQRPFGMARPGADTTGPGGAPAFSHCSGYAYEDAFIQGFSQTRMHGTGVPDYGAIALMPQIGMSADKTTQKGYRAKFSHAREKASPGFYEVTLDGLEVKVELTATKRVALHRYTFPKASDAVVLVDVAHTIGTGTIVDGSVTIDEATREVSGFSHFSGDISNRFGGMPVYFVARFSKAFERFGVWKAGALADGEKSRTGSDVGAYLGFDTEGDAVVDVAIGLSFVDVAHAKMNLDGEGTEGFAATRKAAEDEWESMLSRVVIEASRDETFRIFYTALYHALLMPTLASDFDGSYRGLDKKVHRAVGFRYYTDFSLWDTFRTQHPLLTLLYPEQQLDMLKSLIAMANDGGYMPRWPLGIGYTNGMIGESATIVFADSWVKGIRDFDLRAAYEAMKKTAMKPVPPGSPYGGRGGISDYVAKGWVPIEAGSGSAAMTLEYAYDDHALAKLADALGEKADADAFRARSKNYLNVYDPESGWMLGRHQSGAFERDVDHTTWLPFYVEGNAWQYLWYAPHDLPGLASAMGGRDAMVARLDEFFALSSCQSRQRLAPKTWYWHSNEVDLFAPWSYAVLDRPAKTAQWVRWALQNEYGDGPDGLAGNDDAGTLSAWYVFASIGLFPLAGDDFYLIGSPIMHRTTLKLPAGELIVEGGGEVPYVQSATWNGAPVTRARMDHATIAKGGTLKLTMGSDAGSWGSP